MGESFIVKELQEIASRLTGDPDVQKDLMHEMFLDLVRMQSANPDQPLSWCLRSCEFHVRNHLKPDGRAGAPLPEVARPADALGTAHTTTGAPLRPSGFRWLRAWTSQFLRYQLSG